MLELKKITKVYTTDSFTQKALDRVSINFRENEFVSILGPSGSGKTTLLNIIGGLDDYTSGNLVINGVSTKKYKDRDWDTYRNHKIGFVFQSYNLIPHQSVLANVELALTLSGVSKDECRKRALDSLKRVGLADHVDKKPNQLSGGQMQRVAIARALVNDPDILLADEPTGALDSKTSTQIMDLLKEVAKDRLVIMVTHNSDLAKEYSTRIIELKDGVVLSDSDPFDGKDEEKEPKKDKKTNMSFWTALHLSLNNLLTKKGRTILTAFAGSIGIIGIALILSLSNGVQEYIDGVEEETLTSYPITINSQSIDMNALMTNAIEKNENDAEVNEGKIESNNTIMDTLSVMSSSVKSNNLEAFKAYIEEDKSDLKDYTLAISYGYDLDLQLYSIDYEDKITQVNPDTVLDTIGMSSMKEQMEIMTSGVFSSLFENDEMNDKLYDVVSGRMPEKYNELVVLVDENNRISDYILYALGLESQEELKEMYEKVLAGEEVESETKTYSYEDIVGLKFKVLLNSDYYDKENGLWVYKKDDHEFLKSKLDEAEEIEVVGIIRSSEDSLVSDTTLGGVLYRKDLERHIIEKSHDAKIVQEQEKNPEVNILTGLKFSSEEFSFDQLSVSQQKYLASLSQEQAAEIISQYKEEANATYDSVMTKLGAVDLDSPSTIALYAKDFESKEEIKKIIEDYNAQEEKAGREGNVLNYSDLVGMLMTSVTSIVDMISYVLIGFVSISLIVSSIMIGIITYISVLERTKEIGILRAIGASKKDISRVFNAETLIIGLVSGVIGIGVTIILNIPINILIESLAGVKSISSLPIVGAIVLVLISVLLTTVGGLIPAKMASKKDPVEALRTE